MANWVRLSQSSTEVTSVLMAIHCPLFASISSRTSKSLDSDRAAITSFAPRRPHCLANSAPIPEEAPVIMMVLFLSLIEFSIH